MEVESLQQISEDVVTFGDWTKLKSKKINKTRVMVGPLIYLTDVDNSYLLASALFQKQGGEYRLTPYKLQKKGVCDFIASDEYFVDDLVKNSNFSDPMPCPIPKVNCNNL